MRVNEACSKGVINVFSTDFLSGCDGLYRQFEGKGGMREQVNGTVVWSMWWEGKSFVFTEHLTCGIQEEPGTHVGVQEGKERGCDCGLGLSGGSLNDKKCSSSLQHYGANLCGGNVISTRGALELQEHEEKAG